MFYSSANKRSARTSRNIFRIQWIQFTTDHYVGTRMYFSAQRTANIFPILPFSYLGAIIPFLLWTRVKSQRPSIQILSLFPITRVTFTLCVDHLHTNEDDFVLAIPFTSHPWTNCREQCVQRFHGQWVSHISCVVHHVVQEIFLCLSHPQRMHPIRSRVWILSLMEQR